MTDLPFSMIERPHAEGQIASWIEYTNGRLKRATEEEVLLWQALQEAKAERKEKKR